MKINTYILFLVGLLSIAGAVYLAAGYVRYLSATEKFTALILLMGVFGFLGRHLEERGL